MKITPRNLIFHELIGLNVKVVKCSNKDCIGINGIIVDESKNIFYIKGDDGKIRKLIKRNCVFLFELPSGEKVLVDGRVIVGRPEERIKRVVKKW